MHTIKPFIVDGSLVAAQPAIHQHLETASYQLSSTRCDKCCLNVVASWKQRTRLYVFTKRSFSNNQCITRLLQCARRNSRETYNGRCEHISSNGRIFNLQPLSKPGGSNFHTLSIEGRPGGES